MHYVAVTDRNEWKMLVQSLPIQYNLVSLVNASRGDGIK